MPDGQERYVALPDGRYVHIPGNATPEQLSALRDKLRGTAKPEAGPFTEGFANNMGFSKGNLSAGDMAKEVIANLKSGAGNEYSKLQKMTGEEGKPLSQRGFSEALFIPGMIASGVEGVTGGLEKAGKDIFTPGKGRYGAGEMVGALGQLFAGAEAPKIASTAVDSATGAVKVGARTTVREMLNVPERAVKEARDAHTENMAKVQLDNLQKQNDATLTYEREMREAEEDYAKKRQDTSLTNLQKDAAHKLKVEQIKENHARSEAERQEAFKKKVADVHKDYEKAVSSFTNPGEPTQSAAATAAETRRKAIASQPRSGPVYQRLKTMVDRVATEDVPKLEKTVRQAYNARWGAWREAMGDAEGNFSNVQQAVQTAEADILKGSPENITIFRNILKEGEDPLLSQASVFRKKPGVDLKSVLGSDKFDPRAQERLLASLREAGIEDVDEREGFGMSFRPGEEVKLPIDQIRGYSTELQGKMFRGGFSGDVYRALKHVQEAANKEVERVAQEKGQLATYRQLKGDWSQFLGDFLDSDGSLHKLKNAANADSRLNLISGSEGENIIGALGRYSKFLPKDAAGQTPIDIAGRTRSLMRQLRDLPSKATPPERGTLPSRPEAKPEPALPPAPKPKAMPEFKAPQMKDVPVEQIVPFDLPKFVEERVSKRAEQIGMAGHTLLAYWVIRDIFHGQMPTPQMLAVPIVQHQIRRYLTSPKFMQKITTMAAQ